MTNCTQTDMYCISTCLQSVPPPPLPPPTKKKTKKQCAKQQQKLIRKLSVIFFSMRLVSDKYLYSLTRNKQTKNHVHGQQAKFCFIVDPNHQGYNVLHLKREKGRETVIHASCSTKMQHSTQALLPITFL